VNSPKGMDGSFWEKDLEDVFDWVERLQMAIEVRKYDEEKLFKIAKFNLHNKVKYWYKRLNLTPLDWQTLWILMMVKYGAYDGEDLRSRWMPLGKNQGNGCSYIMMGLNVCL